MITHSLSEERTRLGLCTKLQYNPLYNWRINRNQIRSCHFKTFLHPPSPSSITCLQHVYWGIACKPYHNPRLNINYALSGHWQITGISGCAFVLACTQIKSACKVTIIKVSQGEGEESRGIITRGSGYLSSQGSHWEEPAFMPFTPQKKDRGKTGSWPKPSPRAPQAVPNPAFSQHLLKYLSPLLQPHCHTVFYASSLTVGWEHFYGRGEEPRLDFGLSCLGDLCSRGLSYLWFLPLPWGCTSRAMLLLPLLHPLFPDTASTPPRDPRSALPPQGEHGLPHCSPLWKQPASLHEGTLSLGVGYLGKGRIYGNFFLSFSFGVPWD